MGARVSVQDRETYPLMEEYGVDLAPGTLTSLSLQMVKITRHKYSGCQAITWQESQYGDQLSEQHKSDYRQVSVQSERQTTPTLYSDLTMILVQVLHQYVSEELYPADHSAPV